MLPFLVFATLLAGCSTGGLPSAGPMQATFSDVSDKPQAELAQCIANNLGDDTNLGYENETYYISKKRGLGVLRFRVLERIGKAGSIVEYDSELGRGAELDLVKSCL